MDNLTLAVENADVLRGFDHQPPFANVPRLAEHLGRDASNLRKSIAKLKDAGLLLEQEDGTEMPVLSAEGRALLPRLDVLEGKAPVAPAAPSAAVTDVELALIDQDKALNPRIHFDEDKLAQLTESVRDKGVLQPILIRPNPKKPGRYLVVAGERRWRAATAAKLPLIPAVVRELTDGEALEIAIIENIEREDLNPMEEAHAFRRLIDARMSVDPSFTEARGKELCAEKVKRTVRYVEDRLYLLKLPKADQSRVVSGALSLTNARYAVQNHEADTKRKAKEAAELRAFAISPERLLKLAEIWLKVKTDPDKGHYSERAEVGFEAAADPDLTWLSSKSLASISQDGHYSHRTETAGRYYVYIGWRAREILTAKAPAFMSKKTEATGLEQLRQEACRWPSELHKHTWSTPWLNGPFELSPDIQEIIAQREKEKAEKEAERLQIELAMKRDQQIGAGLLDLAMRWTGLRPEPPSREELITALNEAGCPLPWSLAPDGGGYVDAEGQLVAAGGLAIVARRLLIVHSLNALAGIPTPDLPPKLLLQLAIDQLEPGHRIRVKGKAATFEIAVAMNDGSFLVRQMKGRGQLAKDQVQVPRSEIEDVVAGDVDETTRAQPETEDA